MKKRLPTLLLSTFVTLSLGAMAVAMFCVRDAAAVSAWAWNHPFSTATPRAATRTVSHSSPPIGRAFTVNDDIGFSHFGDRYSERAESILFSPNGKLFAAYTERGRVDINRVEDTLRVYRTADVERVLREEGDQPPLPMWTITASTYSQGPIISDWRWLADSTGIAFLQRGENGNRQLMIGRLAGREVEALTSVNESVKGFDFHSENRYVYTVDNPAKKLKRVREHSAAAVVGTGRYIHELLSPDDPKLDVFFSNAILRAVIDGRASDVESGGQSIILTGDHLALSPDGRWLVTDMLVPEVPKNWETLYPPSYASSPYRVRAGKQSVDAPYGSLKRFVAVEIATGLIRELTGAPMGQETGWFAWSTVKWSKDGSHVLLPNTFFQSAAAKPTRPCFGVVDIETGRHSCVEMVEASEMGVPERLVVDASFVRGDAGRVRIGFRDLRNSRLGSVEYQFRKTGHWTLSTGSIETNNVAKSIFEVKVEESFNEPPKLVARDKSRSIVIWDPNPQLAVIDLGEIGVYQWKDESGRNWRGGLYKPPKYRSDRRYPLIIQTHGFHESEFEPSGIYPTGMAAMALAGAGFLVLQVNEAACPRGTTDEAACAAGVYQAAVKQLNSDAIIDPTSVGIIGFSRSCFYVMHTLTTGRFPVKAASISAGVMQDYVQYMISVDVPGGSLANEANAAMGASPFGDGLEAWLKHSPLFSADKISAPLLVVGAGRASLLSMWSPYAALRYLKRPTEFIMLNTTEHVLTNPAVRQASQESTVDWFRFWLKDEEDPSPKKQGQYERWRSLRHASPNNISADLARM